MKTEKILKSNPDFIEINKIFNDIKKEVRTSSEDTSKPGFGGIFTAEEKKSLEDITFTMYSGGYEQQLKSNLFGFSVNESYTYQDGTAYVFYKGTIENLRKAYSYILKEKNVLNNENVTSHIKSIKL